MHLLPVGPAGAPFLPYTVRLLGWARGGHFLRVSCLGAGLVGTATLHTRTHTPLPFNFFSLVACHALALPTISYLPSWHAC